MTQKDLWIYIESYKETPDEYISICSSPSWLPPANQICPVCNKGWNITNCHDFVDRHKSKLVDLSPFIGKDIAYFKSSWNQSPKIIWNVLPEQSLQNKRYIDKTIVVNHIWEAKDKHQVNERGWVEVQDDHVIEKGDKIAVNIWTLYHYDCFRRRQAKTEKAYFKRVFQSAGFREIIMTQIPNQYHNDPSCTVCAPWYKIVADGIPFMIGWRKRVICVETTDKHVNLEALFRNEGVTMEYHFIHAWGREKCIEYLAKIRKTVKSPFWFAHILAFLPNLFIKWLKNRLSWMKFFFRDPKMYWELRFKKIN